MYAFLWSKIPGPTWVRVLIATAVVAVVLTILVVWVFPAIDDFVVNEEVTI